MARFFGSIQGQRGEATRMGGKASGFRAWAQSEYSRVSVGLSADYRDEDVNEAMISIGPGRSSYHGSHVLFNGNLDDVVAALDGDEKCQALLKRAQEALRKLNDEAPAALTRIERKRKQEQRQRERDWGAAA